jgi:hypothetical protein
MYEIIEANRDKTYEAGQDFLENIIETKGRIPSWGKFNSIQFNFHVIFLLNINI